MVRRRMKHGAQICRNFIGDVMPIISSFASMVVKGVLVVQRRAASFVFARHRSRYRGGRSRSSSGHGRRGIMPCVRGRGVLVVLVARIRIASPKGGRRSHSCLRGRRHCIRSPLCSFYRWR